MNPGRHSNYMLLGSEFRAYATFLVSALPVVVLWHLQDAPSTPELFASARKLCTPLGHGLSLDLAFHNRLQGRLLLILYDLGSPS